MESQTSLSLQLRTGMGTWQGTSVGYGACAGMTSCHTHLLLFLSRSFLCLWLCSQSFFLHLLPVNERQKVIHWAVINHSCICRRLFLLLYRLMRLRKKKNNKSFTTLERSNHSLTWKITKENNRSTSQENQDLDELTKWSQNTSPKLGFMLWLLVPLVILMSEITGRNAVSNFHPRSQEDLTA